jgi:hypothetical protein
MKNGEVPSISNARLIQVCKNPSNFIHLASLSKALKEKEFRKLSARVTQLEQHYNDNYFLWGQNLLQAKCPGVFTGFTCSDQQQILQLIKLSLEPGPLKMKWLPLIFFLVDFGHYRKTARGISGLSYKIENQAITFSNLFGIVNWAAAGGFCRISLNNEGQAVLFPVIDNQDTEQTEIPNIPDRQLLQRNLINIQRQTELNELSAVFLDYSIIKASGENLVAYDAAFELNYFDELSVF